MEVKSFIVYHKERPLSANATDFLTLLRENKPAPEPSGKCRSREENRFELRH